MKGQFAKGFLPYEIGDVITFKDSTTGEHTITDIKFSQYIKDGRTEFEVEVNNEFWMPADTIKERIIKPDA